MTIRTTLSALIAFGGLVGCTPTEEPVQWLKLDAGNASSNVAPIRQALVELCVKRANNADKFGAAVRASGWGWKQTQKIDPKNPVSLEVWEHPSARLIRGSVSPGQIYICTLQVKAGTAPPIALVREALSQVTGQTANRESEWWWKPAFNLKAHMDVAEGPSDIGDTVAVTVETYHLPFLQALSGK